MGLTNADVAIYNDSAYPSGGIWATGLDHIRAMLDRYGYTHEDVTPDDLNATHDLHALYRVLVIGGGWTYGYYTYVSDLGKQHIRDFVSQGGGYFGICAGALFAAHEMHWKPNNTSPVEYYYYGLDLFPGTAKSPVLAIKEWDAPTGCSSNILKGAAMTTVRVDRVLLPGLCTNLYILYYGGPFFTNCGVGVHTVAAYQVAGDLANGQPAMILFRYGRGKVFLTGPHPEVSFENCGLYNSPPCWDLMGRILAFLLSPSGGYLQSVALASNRLQCSIFNCGEHDTNVVEIAETPGAASWEAVYNYRAQSFQTNCVVPLDPGRKKAVLRVRAMP